MKAIKYGYFEYGIVSMSDMFYFVVSVYIKLDEQNNITKVEMSKLIYKT